MSAMNAADARAIALSLPDATQAPHFDYASFRVGGKIFATMPPDQRHLHVFVDEEERQRALALHPAGVEALHWGKRVVGLRIELEGAGRPMLARLLALAWARKAPKRLLPRLPETLAAHVR